jgi:hypothetical protein
MQMWKKTSSKMSYMDMKDRISSIEKDKSLRSVSSHSCSYPKVTHRRLVK